MKKKKYKKVPIHVTRCSCGRINICDEDLEKHRAERRCDGRIIEDREDSAELKNMVGMLILAQDRGYSFI